MLCQFCGKRLDDNSRFCTGCGKLLQDEGVKSFAPKEGESTKEKKKFYQYLEPINQWIHRFGGANKIVSLLMPIIVFAMIAIRLLGVFLCAILCTLCNAYLLYMIYKEEKKIPPKLLLYAIAILIIGLIF